MSVLSPSAKRSDGRSGKEVKMNCFLTNILLATDGSEATEWAME
jgi:hypothetical protein